MMLIITALVVVTVLILVSRSYRHYANGLRERPGYFFWLITCIVGWKGWSKESYCLQTDDLKRLTDGSGYLINRNIPRRDRSRPKMLRGVPHRQLTHQAPDDIMYEMDRHMASLSIPRYGGQTLNKDLLLRGPSVVEYTGADALFLPNASQATFDKGEIAHLHSNDGSFHMKLHPADIQLLIEKQWAERFPLFGLNLFGRIEIPLTYTLVYAPENETDMNTWKIILQAAIDYARDNRNKY